MTLNEIIKIYRSEGKITFTKQEALERSGLSRSAFYKSISRLQKKSRLIQPVQGFFVIVKPEDVHAGGPPPAYFIDQLMKYRNRTYYVGILSAAAFHGASHQAPQVFQVIVDSSMRDIKKGRADIKFIKNGKIKNVITEEKKTPAGYIRTSTIEANAVDIVFYKKYAGGLDNVVNVLIELASSGKISEEKLFTAAVEMHNKATVQRLGYLLDKCEFSSLTGKLAKWVKENNLSRIPLSAGNSRKNANHNKKWHVLENREIEADVSHK